MKISIPTANLQFIFKPEYWVMPSTYCPVYDATLRNLAKTECFWDIGSHLARLGSKVLWIENHPYASFTEDVLWNDKPPRASRLTIQMLKRKLDMERQGHRVFWQDKSLMKELGIK